MEIVGHTVDDLRTALDVMENALDVGEKVRVSLHSEILATEEQCAQLYLELVALGEHTSYPVISVIEGIPTLELELTKGSPALPVAVIPLIALFGILGIITFGILKLEAITKALLPLTLVLVGGVIIIVGLMRQPVGRIAERAGARYLPSTVPKVFAARQPVDAMAASSPFLIEEAIEFKEARSYVESIRNPYLRDYANRYLWHLLSFAKKPSDRGLPETEVRQVERKIAEFIPRTIPQYSTTVNLPQTRQRARISWTRERSESRQEILRSLSLEQEPYWAQPWDKLPVHYRDAIERYYELRRSKDMPQALPFFKKKEVKPKAKYVLMKGTGSIVSVESWEREKASMIARGERPPEVEYIEEKPDKYEPATVEGEPVPEKYRELTPLIDLPLPPGADFLAAVIPEERKIDVVMKQLKDGVESIQDSAQFRLFLTTMAKFHDYSVGNLILISLQKPESTRVAGFVTWKEFGRWVKKGERGIAILAPVMPPKPKKEEDEEEEIVPLTPVYFKVVHVFDIAQTEGKLLPEFEVPVLTGEANEELFSKVLGMAKAQGLDMSFESRPYQDPSIKGQYLPPKSIWVRPEESRAQQLKSLLHEIAHYYSEGVFQMPRRDAETIAESSAFAVGAHYGFDSGVRSFPYVALWAQDKKVLSQNLNTIRKVADTMLHALEGTPKQSVEMLAQVSDEPSAFLKIVWGHLKCRKPKPSISLRRQHSTAVYWTDEHKITIREDSWRKMHPGEKKLIVVHEALHACGAGHQPGYRTATDTMAMLIYKRIWGEDEDWRSFIAELEQRLTRFLRQPSLLPADELLLAVEYLAETEGDPISKFCCRFGDACAPTELLEEGKFPERIAWLRQHYKENHPGMWGKQKLLPLVVTKGTCYQDAWRFLIKEQEGYLVHGTVKSDGKRIGHAWVETETGYIWEPQTGNFYTESEFENVADPVPEHVYEITDAAIMVVRSNNFGPWSDEERGKYLKKQQAAVEYLPDTPEYLAETINAAGYQEKLDDAFQEAIARVRKQDGDSR